MELAAVVVRTNVAPHVLWGMTEADYLAEEGLASEVYAAIVDELVAEQRREAARAKRGKG